MRHVAYTLREHAGSLYVITRAENCLSAALAVLAGGHISGTSLLNGALAIGALATAAVTAGGNVINDYIDRDSDAINKPERPIPAHKVKPRSAAILAAVLFIIGVSTSLLLGPGMIILTIILALLTCLYSWKLKAILLAGNVVVAFLSAMTVIYGGLVVGQPIAAIPGALVIFVFLLFREILATVKDYRGDVAYGIQTVAAIFGKTAAIRIAAAGAVIVIALAFWPWLLGQVTHFYFFVVFFGVLPVLAVGAIWLWFWPEESHVAPTLQVTKLLFFIWLIAMLTR